MIGSVSLKTLRKDNVNTSSVTVEGPGTWTLKEMGDPLDGLGNGAEITTIGEMVEVWVGVIVGVLVGVDVN